MKAMGRVVVLDTERVRRAPRPGAGWDRDEGELPRTWSGCDCCGKRAGEVGTIYPLRHDRLGSRWLVCPTCCHALTSTPTEAPKERIKRWFRR